MGKGFTHTNRETEKATNAAVAMYGLLIEFLQAF